MYGLKTLQEKILSNVLKSEVILASIEHGIYMMEKRLRQNSVLVVLDDVDHTDFLKMFAGSKNWFGKGSRIIFTTRNQDLVNAHGAAPYYVQMLNDREGIELFSMHAFGERKPAQGFKEASHNIVSKFGGHPSALICLGSYLRGKDMSEWMSILNRLEAISVAETLKKFKIRDDGVERNISDQLPI
ncbi:TMV resistance protein N-like [Bidens hawaiensis]|uniref:TMV resistance protein N-like n=1 Tax=Bidens hawaiensis TaxID=980011 RepID=UPI00404963CF